MKKHYHYAEAKKQCIFVGFLGSENGCGNTHLVLSAANYLANVSGKKTAILDLTGGDDYRQAQIILTGRDEDKKSFFKYGIMFYTNAKEDMLGGFDRDYEYALLDLGCAGENRVSLFLGCGIRFLTGALNPWRTKAFITKTISFQSTKGKLDFYSLAAFYCEECVKLYEKATGKEVIIIPFEPDPFKLHGNVIRNHRHV